MVSDTDFERIIARNRDVHDRIVTRYERIHGEIFNDIEQARLCSALKKALDFVRTGSGTIRALDFGCGSGNLTRHLLEQNVHVVAADVSGKFLALVRRRFDTHRLTTMPLNGRNLADVPDAAFDFVAA